MEKFRVVGRIGWAAVLMGSLLFVLGAEFEATRSGGNAHDKKLPPFDRQIRANARQMIDEGRQAFRFDTFGDEAFWGGRLKLHHASAGAPQGVSGGGGAFTIGSCAYAGEYSA